MRIVASTSAARTRTPSSSTAARSGRGEDANDAGRHEGHLVGDRRARRLDAAVPARAGGDDRDDALHERGRRGAAAGPTGVIRLGCRRPRRCRRWSRGRRPLREALGGDVRLCHGGHEFDGRRISAVDTDELKRAAADFAANGIRTVAISSVFSPVNAEAEREAAAVIAAGAARRCNLPSHEIGRIGLLERENATIMNARLRELASNIVAAFRTALAELGIEAPVYLSQNDGTLMAVDYAERYPVATFALRADELDARRRVSLRPRRLRGDRHRRHNLRRRRAPAWVSARSVQKPSRSAACARTSACRTCSLGIGGGSHVDGAEVGPQSVGYELTSRALVFGGTS